MNYMILVNKGRVDPSGSWMFPARTLKTQDWDDLKTAGCLKVPEGMEMKA